MGRTSTYEFGGYTVQPIKDTECEIFFSGKGVDSSAGDDIACSKIEEQLLNSPKFLPKVPSKFLLRVSTAVDSTRSLE